MAAFVAQRARHLRSALLWLDVRGWLLGGLMSLAVVLAFVLALVLHGGEWHIAPYLDSIAGIDQPGDAAGASAQRVEGHARSAAGGAG